MNEKTRAYIENMQEVIKRGVMHETGYITAIHRLECIGKFQNVKFEIRTSTGESINFTLIIRRNWYLKGFSVGSPITVSYKHVTKSVDENVISQNIAHMITPVETIRN